MQDKYLNKRLDGRYVLKEIIGVGGMAVVYKATDITENREVAVKILKDEYAENEEFVRRFINEARAISVLSHTNIVKVYDASVSQAVKYMVMEYIEGITLKEYISRQGNLRWKDSVFFAVQILRALQHAHDKGIVHRDIKPQNIMLLADGTVKVTDFGIARFSRSGDKTITEKAMGSVHYISPEQARGEANTDERADIYSLGVIMYEMLTGKLPFEAENAVSVALMQLQAEPLRPTELDGSIPIGLEQITLHAMKKDTYSRYQSAAEMLNDLEEFRRDPEMTFDFGYFVDDEPTRFVETEEGKSESKKDKKKKKKEEQGHSVALPILSGIAAAFVIAALVIGSFFAYDIFGNKTEGHTVVDFTGHTYTSIVEYYGNVFTFEAKYEFNENYEPGIVIAQSHSVGRKVKKTQTITLTVSQGTEQVEVPNVIGKTVAEAKPDLDRAKLVYQINYLETEEYASGKIISVNPAEGKKVAEGTVITLTVAKQPGVEDVEVPQVTKFTLASAKKILEREGFTVNGDAVEVYSNGYTLDGEKIEIELGQPAGYVVAQTPDPSIEPTAPKGTAVTLYVSNGKKYIPVEIAINLPNEAVVGNQIKLVAKQGNVVIGESDVIERFTGIKQIIFNSGVTTAFDSTEAGINVQIYIVGIDSNYNFLYQVLLVNTQTGNYTVVM